MSSLPRINIKRVVPVKGSYLMTNVTLEGVEEESQKINCIKLKLNRLAVCRLKKKKRERGGN